MSETGKMRVRVTRHEMKGIQYEKQRKSKTAFILLISRYCFQ